jgi:NAD(P)-dependent dehydrogenase (short-subunit alcohol dehydrogenase family)
VSKDPAKIQQRIAVITGACGGMGRVCARLLGQHYALALIDVDQQRLDHDAEQLRRDGYDVPLAMAVDITDAAAVRQLSERVRAAGSFGALVNTAGLSPALAPWQPILAVNLVGTVLLLDAFLPLATAGSVAVCIASVAGHRGPPEDGLDSLLDQCLDASFSTRIEPILETARIPGDPFGLGTIAYSISKYAVIRLCEQRARAWAERGARIVSVSPGIIATPMGDKELRDNQLAAAMFDGVPHRRAGRPLDIANAVDFLCSERADYINGCDLRVDYGTVAGLHHPTR